MSPLRRIQRTGVSIYCHPNSQQSADHLWYNFWLSECGAVPTSLGSGPGAKSALAMHSQCCQHPAGPPAAFQDTCRIPLHWFRQTRCGPHVSGMDWPTKGMSWSLPVVPCCALLWPVPGWVSQDAGCGGSCSWWYHFARVLLVKVPSAAQFLQQTLPTLPSLLFWPNILISCGGDIDLIHQSSWLPQPWSRM